MKIGYFCVVALIVVVKVVADTTSLLNDAIGKQPSHTLTPADNQTLKQPPPEEVKTAGLTSNQSDTSNTSTQDIHKENKTITENKEDKTTPPTMTGDTVVPTMMTDVSEPVLVTDVAIKEPQSERHRSIDLSQIRRFNLAAHAVANNPFLALNFIQSVARAQKKLKSGLMDYLSEGGLKKSNNVFIVSKT